MTTYRKQEQEPATDEVTEVAPGVLRTQLPIALPGLGHVNCYVLEDGEGFCLVDPGLPGEEPWKALVAALGRAGVPLPRVHSVFVTHSHHDHFGGAARLREETGADIITHRDFKLWWELRLKGDVQWDASEPGRFELPVPWGGEPFRPPKDSVMDRRRVEMLDESWTPHPTKRLDDADVITLARRDWVAVHTPGHTVDHLCLYDPVEGTVLSGDHVLPTITPHISGLERSQEDPLAAFFASLDRVAQLDGVHQVLPAHGHPFSDLKGRVDAIKEHHLERLARLRSVGADGDSASVHDYMLHLFSERAWGSMAESETFAHLEHLRLTGGAESHWEDGVLLYSMT